MSIPVEFKPYQSKPVTRFALEVGVNHVISQIDDSTSELSIYDDEKGEFAVIFKHYEPVKNGDFIVWLKDDDIYHCSRAVFLERNVVEG